MKKILIVSFEDLRKSRRVWRQINQLKDKYEVYTSGHNDSGIENVKFFWIETKYKSMKLVQKLKTALLLLFRLYMKVYNELYDYKRALQKLSNIRFDLIIVHGLKPLPFVYMLDQNPRILFEAREFYSGQAYTFVGNIFYKNFFLFLEDKYLSKQKHLITVCQGIADEYHKKYNNKPEVITSASEFIDMEPSNVESDRIRLVHHGIALKGRNLHLMIEMMDYVDDRFELEFMMVPYFFHDAYLNKIRKMCEKRKNVNIIQPVSPEEVAIFCNKYDIGLYILPPNSTSNKYIFPRKFFEYIQSRLAIAIGPSIEMANYVKKYDLGIVADDFKPQTLAKLLNKITKEEIEYYKNQCHKYARELSCEKSMEYFEEIVRNII